MRLERLEIPAFGPFTDLELPFPAHACDLHVIFGQNEAGKSSLLRAIRDLLFGIHGQSADNFRHDYKNLRIRGGVSNRAGERLVFQRRKGNKNTLLDAAGNQLPDTALAPFLGSVDQNYFSTMFGLGGAELREGARQLLSADGEVGNALFSASLGGTPIQKVLAALTEESERLFKGRATSNVTIRPAATRHKELLRQSREAVVNPETWETIEKAMAAAEETRKTLEQELAELSRRLEWIARCQDALPAVGRLSEQMQRLGELPPLPEVSSDFVARVRTARVEVSATHGEVGHLRTRLTALQRQLAECEISPAVLENAATVDRLHQELGSFRDRKKAWSDRETKLAGIAPALRGGMQNLGLEGGPEAIETLRLGSAAQLGCEEAARSLNKAVERQEANTAKLTELKIQIATREKQLKSLPEADLAPLRDALASAAGAIEADRTLVAAEAEAKRLAREAAERHGRLPEAPKNLAATADLTPPSKATIRRVRDAMDEIRRDIKAEEAVILEAKKRIESIQAELGRIARRGTLPSPDTLRGARQRRDHGWTLVLAEWKGGGTTEELVPGVPLEDAFPQTVAQADGIADGLFEHAEAVAQAEEKRFQISKSETQSEKAENRFAELRSALEKCQSEWEEAWKPCGVTPRTPDEMEEWREDWSEFKELLGKLTTAQEALEQKRQQVQKANEALAAVLDEPEAKGFSALFEAARSKVRSAEKTEGVRETVAAELKSLAEQRDPAERERARLAQAAEAATLDWNTRCKAVGLPAGISPASGLALLQERKDLLARFDRWSELSAEAETLSRQVSDYDREVGKTAAALGVKGDTAEAQEAALWKALGEAKHGQTRHDQLADQVKSAEVELEARLQAASQSAQALEALLRMAKLNSTEELEPLLTNLESREQMSKQIATFRDTLSGLARGRPVDEFIAQVRGESPDEFPRRKTQHEGERQEKESLLQRVQETLSETKRRKHELEKAGDAAAEHLQQAESLAATLREDAGRFVRLRLATQLLQAQIERFRKENQGPLLERSGRLFQSITRGAFSGLDAEFSAEDVPVLVGSRPDGTTVAVEGMSEGTRDQLYLALRLAALERYLEEHEPMPLVLDDLLITFDNERAKAILPQLATLAGRTQVFLFTHHEHLVDLCRQTLGEGKFQLHRLEAGTPAPQNGRNT